MSYLFYAGLDLGQAADFTALAIIEELVYCPEAGGWVSWTALTSVQKSDYHAGFGWRWRAQTREKPPLWLRTLHRYPLRTPYPDIVADVVRRLNRATLLVIDGTGVGAAVVDMFRFADPPLPCDLYPAIITGGVKQDGNHVPKRDLIGAVQAVVQTGQLHIAEQTTEAKTFLDEIQNYRLKLTDTGHDTYNAREGKHDDLVLAVSLAAWQRSRLNRGE